MKSFYTKLLIFLFPVLLAWAGLEWFYRTAETNYTFKHQTISENPDTYELLIMGNSHTLYGLNPAHFSNKTFNLANTSQSLYFDELLLQKHLPKMPNAKAVIIPISYFSLSQQDNTSDDLWRKYFYRAQMDLEVPIVSTIDPRAYSLSLTRKLKPSFELLHEYFDKGTVLGCDENGYGLQGATDIVSNKDRIAPIIARKHENGSMDFENALRRLERIINLCKKQGVSVFLIEMPVYSKYYELLNKEKKQKIQESCTVLAQQFDNAHFLSLVQDPRFEASDLRDADHLTNEGAEKCSRIVNDFIVQHISK